LLRQKNSFNNPIRPVDELIASHVEKVTPRFELTAAHITMELVFVINATNNNATPSERIRKFLVTVVTFKELGV
jgi:hypothetical protein